MKKKISVDQYKEIFHTVREALLTYKPLYQDTQLATTSAEYDKAYDIAFTAADKIKNIVEELKVSLTEGEEE